MQTKPAYKAVSQGIQAVEARLRRQGDGKARMFYLRDSLVELDPLLVAAKLPTCTEDEYDVYVWDKSNNRKKGEEPVKKYDHGQDGTRYMVAYVDEIGKNTPNMFAIGSVTKSGAGSGDGSLAQQSGWRMESNAPSRWG